ncbi:MAG: tetratricopeptide repeat protein [Phycisphaerae bacterium]|nr:tetratricopeptide repeat protein [Phycisphaerae bacterium]
MKRYSPIACILILTAGGVWSFLASPCFAELDEIDLLLREANSADESPLPALAPGKETRVPLKDLGEHGYYMVYLPKDYTPNRRWPVIFCYHSMNDKPTTEPFRTVLEGEHFVLVGVGYQQSGREGYDYMKTKDVEILKRVLRGVHRQVRMNLELLFVGGYSKGAFYAAGMLNHMPEAQWAGGVMLGGGMSKPEAPKRRKSLYKLPVFLACGDRDPHRKYVETAADHFKDMNSAVTLEIWPKTGHVELFPGSKLREWLIANGPLRDASDRLARAKVYDKTKRLGLALDLYETLAHVDPNEVVCQQADIAATRLSAKARAQLDRAAAVLEKKEYPLAQNLLEELAEEFKGSHFGEEATERLKKLQSDPEIQKTLARQRKNEQARQLKAKADAAENQGRFSEAIRLYESYLQRYPKSDDAADVKKRLDRLRSDDHLQRKIRDQQAAHDCKGWLNMADALLEQGKPDLAKKYLDKIIRKYPDTTWAVKAQVRLRNL